MLISRSFARCATPPAAQELENEREKSKGVATESAAIAASQLIAEKEAALAEELELERRKTAEALDRAAAEAAAQIFANQLAFDEALEAALAEAAMRAAEQLNAQEAAFKEEMVAQRARTAAAMDVAAEEAAKQVAEMERAFRRDLEAEREKAKIVQQAAERQLRDRSTRDEDIRAQLEQARQQLEERDQALQELSDGAELLKAAALRASEQLEEQEAVFRSELAAQRAEQARLKEAAAEAAARLAEQEAAFRRELDKEKAVAALTLQEATRRIGDELAAKESELKRDLQVALFDGQQKAALEAAEREELLRGKLEQLAAAVQAERKTAAEIQAKLRSTEAAASRAPEPVDCLVEFCVNAPHDIGDLFVCGNAPALGEWKVENAVPMKNSDGIWRTQVCISNKLVTYKYVAVDRNTGRQVWQNGQDNVLSIRPTEDFVEVVDAWNGDPLASKVVSATGVEGRQERLVNLLTEIVKTAPQTDGVTRGAAALELMAHSMGPASGRNGAAHSNGNGNGNGNGAAGGAGGKKLEESRGR